MAAVAFTPAEVIADARVILNDTDSLAPRDSDADLLRFVNQGIKEIANHKPELFSTVGDMLCQAGQCEQSITFSDAMQILDVLCIHGGAAITPFDRRAMDLFRPAWRQDAEGPAEQWAPIDADPLRFFIFPKAPADQTIDVLFARNPDEFDLGDVIADLPEVTKPALVDYVVYRAQSKDDPHVISQRAQSHYTAFLNKIGVKTHAAA